MTLPAGAFTQLGDIALHALANSAADLKGALSILLLALWLTAIAVLVVSYRRGGRSWSDYAEAKLGTGSGAIMARLSGFSTELAVATIGLASLAGHVWLTRSLGAASLSHPLAIIAALAFAVLVPLAYCRWARNQIPADLAHSDDDRRNYACGYSYYWIYGAVLLLAACIEGLIVWAEWRAAATAMEARIDETGRLLAFPSTTAADPAVQARLELVLASYDRFNRSIIELVSTPLLPLLAASIVLYLFLGGSGFHASFAGGGAALVYGLAAVLALASIAALGHGLATYLARAAELQSELQPLLDDGYALQSAAAVRRFIEISTHLNNAQGLPGFLRTMMDERGAYYGLFAALYYIGSWLVIAISKSVAGWVR